MGIDLSETPLVRARQRYGGLDFQLMDATRLGFCDGSVDAALFSYNGIDGIYPLAARVRCLAEVFRVLKPGGPFLLSSQNLIGAIFSGGYHYLRGYWRAARMLAMQCTKTRWRVSGISGAQMVAAFSTSTVPHPGTRCVTSSR